MDDMENMSYFDGLYCAWAPSGGRPQWPGVVATALPIAMLLTAMVIAVGCSPAAPAAAAPTIASAGCEQPPEAPTAPAPEAPDAHSFTEGQQQIVMTRQTIQYGPCPPAIPFECEMAVLEGSPKKPGLFTVRFRSEQPWLMPPHSHPRAERVTILSGNVSVGFGETVDRTAGRQFSTGDYYVNAAGAVHYVWADGPMELQITGMGPWEVHPHAH